MSAEYPPPGQRGDAGSSSQNIATAISDISERATLLVREEIELAKAEVTEKAAKLVRGAVVGIVAGVFFVTALMFVLVGCAWALYYYLPIGSDYTYFVGFFAMALILVVLGVIAGLLAARLVKRSSPPVPTMAIDEARKIRDSVSSGAGVAGEHVPAQGPPAAVQAPVSVQSPVAESGEADAPPLATVGGED